LVTSHSPFSISPTARQFLAGEFRARSAVLAGMLFGGALNAFLEVTGLALVFPLLAMVMSPDHAPGMRYVVGALEAIGVDANQRNMVIALGIAIAITLAVKNIYMISFNWWQSRVLARWKTEVSGRLMRIYVLSDLRLHMEVAPGIMVRNLSFAGLVFDQYVFSLLNLAVNAIVALAVTVLLSFVLPPQTMLGIGVLAAGAALIFLLLRSRFGAIGRENEEIYRARSLVLQSGIGAIRESKILNREHYFLGKFEQVESRAFDRQAHFTFLASLPILTLETIIVLSMLAIVAHIIFVTGAGAEGLATIGVLAAAMFRLLPMTLRMVGSLQLMNVGKASLETLAAEIAAHESRVRVPDVGAEERLGDWRAIELRNVGFLYPDGTRALHGINLTIRRGEFIGITGPSGSGKSTLMLILLGLAEPTDGTISVDGQPFSDPQVVRRWQNGIGYVPQDLFLVDGSIADNVAFGRPSPDMARVREAVTIAQLDEYVESQPDGLQARVGDYGERLSGGQKQRVVIARALYRDPDVVAFDEATSTLDVVLEKALTDHVLKFRGDKSVLAIAHRLSTIEHCDRIIFLESGELKGFAPFSALKATNENFKTLASQAKL
jgi:ABC-type multidrug transport system fused ATPase/permease subunit